MVCLGAICGCAKSGPIVEFPPAPQYPTDHRYTLDELVELSIHRNASLDFARYQAESAQGLVDEVKALWLPKLRYTFASVFYDNDLNYKANVYGLSTLNVPITGSYNFVNSLAFTQILATSGKRTSGLKQAKLFAAIRKLEVLRQQDYVAFSVANFYHLIGLTNDIDVILEDASRRIAVLAQVARGLQEHGSLRGNRLDSLQADYLVNQLEQLRIATQSARQSAYQALRQCAGVEHDEALQLRHANLPPAAHPLDAISVYASIVKGFCGRTETHQIDMLASIGKEQLKLAKANHLPNVAIAGSYVDTRGNHHAILNALDGLVASVLVDTPIYDPAQIGHIRSALGLEQAALALQREVERLITLEIEVTAIEAQRAAATLIKAARAREIARQHYLDARQAYSRELVPASIVVIAIGLDALARTEYEAALFAYHNAKACLKRVTADREAKYGY